MPDHDDSPVDLDEEAEDAKRKSPARAFEGIQPAPLPMMAADGGPIPHRVRPEAPAPPADPRIFKCLQGPCRYYWQIKTHIMAGNPQGTFDEADGLRETTICPECGGRPLGLEPPALADGEFDCCNYISTQGQWKGWLCRLTRGHEGAHHHDHLEPPKPRVRVCPTCDNAAYTPNPTGARVKEPRLITRTCLVNPGTETTFPDDVVYECNRWDPLLPKELAAIAKRRESYLQRHPEHAPKE